MNLFSFFRRKSLPKPKNRIDDVRGEHYDLQSVYNRLNALYFNDKLDLSITWFGCPHRSVKTQRILGLYEFKSRLIKVHRLLDHPRFPPYFISYIVYHEMLHSVLPPLRRKKGRCRIHHGEFKEREKCFAEYDLAREFEKQNLKLFFMSRDLRNTP
jgi:hypothetical protein